MNEKDVLARIDFLLKHAKSVEDDLHNISLDKFSESSLLARAVSFSILQIGEQVTKLQSYLQPIYTNIPWNKVRGMRNIIVHVYHQIDFAQVYKTAKEDIPEIKKIFSEIKDDLISRDC